MKFAVKDLSKLYNNGDLGMENFDEDPKEIHKKIQNSHKNSKSEVYVKLNLNYKSFDFEITGFIDSIIDDKIIEEIKTTSKNLGDINLDYRLDYLAQLKLYGYIYSYTNKITHIDLKLTYVHAETLEKKEFDIFYSYKELEEFFYEALDKQVFILKRQQKQETNKLKTIKEMKFPFDSYRPGQRDLMKKCYYTIKNNSTLFAVAPTGIGKTLATLFSSLKSIDQENVKIFYLTAKSIGKQIAINAINLMFNNNLNLKAIELTSKEKSCLLSDKNCDPDKCPFSKGYYQRLDNAINDIYNEKFYDFETIKKYAIKNKICPFEFSLDLSYVADIIIGDYNYAFDPFAHLIRYFEETTYKNILLVDEAHNLITRSRDMYSSSLNIYELSKLPKILKGKKPIISTQIKGIKEIINDLKSDESVILNEIPQEIIKYIITLSNRLGEINSNYKDYQDKSAVIGLYKDILKFNKLMKFYDSHFRFIINPNGDFSINCLDASKFLIESFNNSLSNILFSATLEPISYYKYLLSRDLGDEIFIDSPFDPNNLLVLINDKISTKYKDRENTIHEIIDSIYAITSYKTGNYIVFFPSYKYLKLVEEKLLNTPFEVISQVENMSELERIEFVEAFKNPSTTKVFLCIMGGSFSEGIDYIGDMLSGVVIVGVGLPMINPYNDVLKDYYKSLNKNGFDYAYTLPGINKVIQGVGRIVRSDHDKGVAILIDDRFNSMKYKNLFPKSWNYKYISNGDEIKKEINRFK